MVLFDELDKSGLISVQPMYLVVAVPDDDDDSSIMILPISMAAVNMPRSLRKAHAFVCLQRGMSAKSNVAVFTPRS